MADSTVARRSYLPQRRRAYSVAQHAVNLGGRLLVCGVAIVAQLAIVVYVATYIADLSGWFVVANGAVAVVAALAILNSKMPAAYKLAWLVPVLVVPVGGVLFYVLYGARKVAPWTMRRWRGLAEQAALALREVPPADLPASAPVTAHRQVTALQANSPYVLRDHSECRYWGMGQDGFPHLLAAVEAAERYITCEYFIVEDGELWAKLFDALQRKAAAGVEVKFLYDDLGSLFTLPPQFMPTLRAAGIQVHRVNPLGMRMSVRYNNRDHRKILSVDGKVAFTGGINLADEYINARERFGVWKDTVLRVEGPAAWSLTVMTLELWTLVTGEHLDYDDYLPHSFPERPDAGWCLPYADSPYRDISLAELTYRQMIMRAESSVDIFTPYLVPDDEMTSLLQAVASAGVRVRIVVPGIPDKPYVYAVTRSFYAPLIRAGVEIYEYSPGFIHAKVCCVDDEVAVVGSINFDYRSFFLQQEDAVWMYGTTAVAEVVADVAATLPECRRITRADVDATPWWKQAGRVVLRLFAPLM